MAYAFSASAAGAAGSDTVTVSGTGFTAGQWITLIIRLDGNGSTFTGTPGGAGFSLITTINEALANIGEPQQLSIYGGVYISGNFVVNVAGAGGTTPSCIAVAHSGRVTTAPTNFTPTQIDGGASPVSIPLAGLTASALDDVLWIGCIAAGSTGGTWVTTAPAGYTSRQEVSETVGLNYSGTSCVCTIDGVSAGATGTLTGSSANTGHSGDKYGLVLALSASGGSTAPSKFPPFGIASLAPLAPLSWIIRRRQQRARERHAELRAWKQDEVSGLVVPEYKKA